MVGIFDPAFDPYKKHHSEKCAKNIQCTVYTVHFDKQPFPANAKMPVAPINLCRNNLSYFSILMKHLTVGAALFTAPTIPALT
jgi:hypothetical protein